MKSLLFPVLVCAALAATLAHAQGERKGPGRAPAIDPPGLLLPVPPVGVPHLVNAKPEQLARELGDSTKYLIDLQTYHRELEAVGTDEARKRMAEAEKSYESERAWVVRAAAQLGDWATRTDVRGRTTAQKLGDKSFEFKDPHE